MHWRLWQYYPDVHLWPYFLYSVWICWNTLVQCSCRECRISNNRVSYFYAFIFTLIYLIITLVSMMDDESSTTVFLLLFFETIKTKFCYLKFLTLCTAYLWFTIRKLGRKEWVCPGILTHMQVLHIWTGNNFRALSRPCQSGSLSPSFWVEQIDKWFDRREREWCS